MAAHEPRMFGDLSPRADDRTDERNEFDWARMRCEENPFTTAAATLPDHISKGLKRAMGRFDKSLRPDPEVQRLKRLPYGEYLQTQHWRQFRRWIIQRDYCCRLCTSRKQLEVHHLDYDRRGEEAKEDVIVLCTRCHEKWHKRGPFRYTGDQK